MKRILFFTAFLVSFLTANAQIRLDFQAGLSSPMGDAFEYSKNLGLGYGFDVMYAPDMIMDGQLSFGLEKSGNLLLTASGDWEAKGFDLSASKLGFWGAKVRFDLDKKGPRPYASIALGVGHIKSYYLYNDYDGASLQQGIDNDFAKGCMEDNAFMAKPEIGVAFGFFTMGVGWLLPSKFTDNNTLHTMKAGAVQCNIGFRIKID